jgi:hypothetical protein
VRTGALWALAALTRPEAGLLLLLWGSALLIDTETRDSLRRFLAGALPPAIIYGAWLLFARFYFGTFWPQTLVAKSVGNQDMATHMDNLWRQFRVFGATDGILLLALVVGMLFGSRWRAMRPSAQRFIPWAWALGLPALYVARGVPVISRYVVPLMPVIAWLAWRSVERWWMGDEPSSARRRQGLVFAGILGALVLGQNLVVYRTTVLPQVRTFTPALESSLGRWGRWFHDHTPKDAVIATPDIGAIGYYSDRRVLDLGGLVTPKIVPLMNQMDYDSLVKSFAFRVAGEPDYLIDRGQGPKRLLHESPYWPALDPVATARTQSLAIAKPGPVDYTLYKVDWAVVDSLEGARARTSR